MLSRDMAIDLGTANTLVYVKGQAIHVAREARASERKTAKKRGAEVKAEMEAAHLAAQAAADEENRRREIALEAERKADRDRRYAARKARKK